MTCSTPFLINTDTQNISVYLVDKTSSINPAILYGLDWLILQASSIFIFRSFLDKVVWDYVYFTLFNKCNSTGIFTCDAIPFAIHSDWLNPLSRFFTGCRGTGIRQSNRETVILVPLQLSFPNSFRLLYIHYILFNESRTVIFHWNTIWEYLC